MGLGVGFIMASWSEEDQVRKLNGSVPGTYNLCIIAKTNVNPL